MPNGNNSQLTCACVALGVGCSFTYRIISIRIQENRPATLKGFKDFFSDKPIRFYDFDAK